MHVLTNKYSIVNCASLKSLMKFGSTIRTSYNINISFIKLAFQISKIPKNYESTVTTRNLIVQCITGTLKTKCTVQYLNNSNLQKKENS